MKNLFASIALFISNFAFADNPAVPAGTTASAADGAQQAPGMGSMLVPFTAMIGVMYFFMIRPQQKKAKEQQAMLKALKEGDEVLTTSGILGTVKGITDRVVTLQIDRDVSVKMLKSQVAHVVNGKLPEVTGTA